MSLLVQKKVMWEKHQNHLWWLLWFLKEAQRWVCSVYHLLWELKRHKLDIQIYMSQIHVNLFQCWIIIIWQSIKSYSFLKHRYQVEVLKVLIRSKWLQWRCKYFEFTLDSVSVYEFLSNRIFFGKSMFFKSVFYFGLFF